MKGFSQEPNRAYFKIIEKESVVEVIAEFPWSFRNALLLYSPALEKQNDSIALDTVFRAYLIKNLVLFDADGTPFEFESYEYLKVGGYSYQNTYKIIFKGENLRKIKNTIMFNLYLSQTNCHLFKESESFFKTTLKSNLIVVPTLSNIVLW
ncbi:MAG: hypothetical protein COB98_06855, partial [Flavobacteriaceae bacterium]